MLNCFFIIISLFLILGIPVFVTMYLFFLENDTKLKNPGKWTYRIIKKYNKIYEKDWYYLQVKRIDRHFWFSFWEELGDIMVGGCPNKTGFCEDIHTITDSLNYLKQRGEKFIQDREKDYKNWKSPKKIKVVYSRHKEYL